LAARKTGGGKRGGAGGRRRGAGPAATGGGKRPIEQYEHGDKRRANNPPVGLVTRESDR
jgi:hypothetical protein